MKKILFTIIFILEFQAFVYSQYETGGRKSLEEFTDLDGGPMPKWSPCGDRLAFMTSLGILVEKNDSTLLIEGAQNDFQWSMNGEAIIYTAKDQTGTLKIFKYQVRTGMKTLISLKTNWSDFYPRISPDDSTIAYYSAKNEPFKIYYFKNGVTEKIHCDFNTECLHPEWSPSGMFFCYTEHKQPEPPLLQITDTKLKKIIASVNSNDYDFLDWSPDEKEILFRECVGQRSFHNGRILRVSVMSGEKIFLTKQYKNLFTAKWSNKSDKIVFSGDGKIYTMNSDGSSLHKIVSKGWFPTFHPSGKKIIFCRLGKGVFIYEVDMNGKNLHLLYSKRNTKDYPFKGKL